MGLQQSFTCCGKNFQTRILSFSYMGSKYRNEPSKVRVCIQLRSKVTLLSQYITRLICNRYNLILLKNLIFYNPLNLLKIASTNKLWPYFSYSNGLKDYITNIVVSNVLSCPDNWLLMSAKSQGMSYLFYSPFYPLETSNWLNKSLAVFRH